MKQVLVIVGPTASGKSALGIKLATYFQTEIINGDSVQVYKHYDIGSAKINEAERKGIVHHLIDIVHPDETYDVKNFQEDARDMIHNISFPIIVGGTGFYIKAALYDYDFSAEERRLKDTPLNNEALFKYIQSIDPLYQGDSQNRRRLLRAYELVKQGHMPSSKTGKNDVLYDICTIYLDIRRDQLKKRLRQRLDKQLEQGFIQEVKEIMSMTDIKEAIGYREIADYLRGLYDYDTMKETIIKKSMIFAKKQKTWFKNQMNAHVFDATSEHLFDDVKEVIESWKK
jgi:tRNA dimethylallyltransferase